MKRIILILVAVVALGTSAMAQNNLGARLGVGYGVGAELSWQHGLGGNRMEWDLGISSHDKWGYANLTGIYQWTWNITGGLGWYAGVGANLSILTGDYSGFGLGIDGQVGLEYNFNIPLQLSLDFRPAWHLIGKDDYRGLGWGGLNLGIRYRF